MTARIFGTGVALCAVLLILASCGGSDDSPGEQDGVTDGELDVRLCTPADVELSVAYGAIGSSVVGNLILENVASDACGVQGAPVLELLDSAGAPLPVEQITRDETPAPPVALEPAARAQSFFAWGNWCEGGVPRGLGAGPIEGGLTLRMTLPGGGEPLLAETTADGLPMVDTPRCDAPGTSSSVAVDPFEPRES